MCGASVVPDKADTSEILSNNIPLYFINCIFLIHFFKHVTFYVPKGGSYISNASIGKQSTRFFDGYTVAVKERLKQIWQTFYEFT